MGLRVHPEFQGTSAPEPPGLQLTSGWGGGPRGALHGARPEPGCERGVGPAGPRAHTLPAGEAGRPLAGALGSAACSPPPGSAARPQARPTGAGARGHEAGTRFERARGRLRQRPRRGEGGLPGGPPPPPDSEVRRGVSGAQARGSAAAARDSPEVGSWGPRRVPGRFRGLFFFFLASVIRLKKRNARTLSDPYPGPCVRARGRDRGDAGPAAETKARGLWGAPGPAGLPPPEPALALPASPRPAQPAFCAPWRGTADAGPLGSIAAAPVTPKVRDVFCLLLSGSLFSSKSSFRWHGSLQRASSRPSPPARARGALGGIGVRKCAASLVHGSWVRAARLLSGWAPSLGCMGVGRGGRVSFTFCFCIIHSFIHSFAEVGVHFCVVKYCGREPKELRGKASRRRGCFLFWNLKTMIFSSLFHSSCSVFPILFLPPFAVAVPNCV